MAPRSPTSPRRRRIGRRYDGRRQFSRTSVSLTVAVIEFVTRGIRCSVSGGGSWAILCSHRQEPDVGEHGPRLGLSDERSRGDETPICWSYRDRRLRTSLRTES